MQQTIRALGWATKLFWVILIFVAITIAYSATQISIDFGQPQTISSEQGVVMSFPISISNQGLYDLAQLNITTRIANENSRTLSIGSTTAQLVQRGKVETINNSVTISYAQIMAQSSLLFNDTLFTVFQYVSLNYANAIPTSAHANYTMQWGAPLSNLVISGPTYAPYNSTCSIVTVQLYFENHSQYIPVTGVARIEIYNTQQTLEGAGTANIEAQPNTSCNAQVNVLAANFLQVSPRGEIHLFFETPLFSYGPLVVSFG
jgi:hypothetical protein